MITPLYIVNPAALGGLGKEGWNRFCAQHPDLPGLDNAIITDHPGQARDVSSSATEDTLVAVGGDGTVGEILSGIMTRKEPRPGLAVIPAGTGNDIARVAGIRSIDDAAAALRDNARRRLDLFRINCMMDGTPVERYGCLASYVGFSVVNSRTLKPWMKRLLGAKKAYYLATILGIVRYRLPSMTVHAGSKSHHGRTWMVIVGNVARIGGNSMCVAPGASPNDGLLNVSIVSAMSKPTILWKLRGISTGSHVNEPEVDYFPATTVDVRSEPPATVEVDGDVCGTTPVTYTVCPNALEVLTPEPAARR